MSTERRPLDLATRENSAIQLIEALKLNCKPALNKDKISTPGNWDTVKIKFSQKKALASGQKTANKLETSKSAAFNQEIHRLKAIITTIYNASLFLIAEIRSYANPRNMWSDKTREEQLQLANQRLG